MINTINKILHSVFGWHKPNDQIWLNGINYHSHCRYCKKPIMKDSQGK